ncbi:MAG: hypothetical protein ABJH05_11955 [Fulvivirga sp.]
MIEYNNKTMNIYKYLILLAFLIQFNSSFSKQFQVLGQGSACHGDESNYVLVPEYIYGIPQGCFVSDIERVDISSNGILKSTGSSNLLIEWHNQTTNEVEVQVSVLYWGSLFFMNYGCTQPMLLARTFKVKVKPAYASKPTTPSPVNFTFSSGGNYTLTTNSSGADQYKWVVNGGSIINTSNTRTLQVRPSSGSCGLSGFVQAINNGSCGAKAYSTKKYFSKTISTPSRPGVISEYEIDNSRSSYSINPVSYASRYEWTLSATGIDIQSNSSRTSVILSCSSSSGSGTLRVRAVNTCGKSSYSSLFVDCNNSGNGGGDCGGILLTSTPNPINRNENLIICPDGLNQVEIIDPYGNVIRKIPINPDNNIISLHDLNNSLYYLRYTKSNGEVKIERLIVK